MIAQTVEDGSLFGNEGSGYSVKLDSFEGPLDLLLHLIRKNEVDIYDIPIALITKQYLEYINVLKELNLDLAGEFLVMAATLLQIKSRMLLPGIAEPEQDEGEGEDPRAELVRRLLDYQRYREAGVELSARTLLGREVFVRPCSSEGSCLQVVESEDEILDLDLYHLAEAFNRLVATIPQARVHEVAARESLSIVDAISGIMSALDEGTEVAFSDLFDPSLGREGLIVTFLALLELCKLRMIKIVQSEPGREIYLMMAVAPDSASIESDDE